MGQKLSELVPRKRIEAPSLADFWQKLAGLERRVHGEQIVLHRMAQEAAQAPDDILYRLGGQAALEASNRQGFDFFA